MPTVTGNFPLGFRRGWTEWQKDVKTLAAWAMKSGFEALDLNEATPADVRTVKEAGLRIGSVDVIGFSRIMSNDAGERREVIQRNVETIPKLAAEGAKIFFTCVLPGDPSKSRQENYKLAVECYRPLTDAAAAAGAHIAIEGYPGTPPFYGGIGCAPETIRALLRDLGPGAAINYDPSHLIRIGVDHIRFLQEFAERVVHVHAKDTELRPEDVYEFGLYQPATFAPGHGFGAHVWRYTLPGQGQSRWPMIVSILKQANYRGALCVELEDERFNGSESGEKAGLQASLAFLKGL